MSLDEKGQGIETEEKATWGRRQSGVRMPQAKGCQGPHSVRKEPMEGAQPSSVS
jgi:hypothetical protein